MPLLLPVQRVIHFYYPRLKGAKLLLTQLHCLQPTGYTYERLAIQEWLSKSQASPLTNMPLQSKHLVPNHLLRWDTWG